MNTDQRIELLENNMKIALREIISIAQLQGQVAADLTKVATNSQLNSDMIAKHAQISVSVNDILQDVNTRCHAQSDEIDFLARVVLWMGTTLQHIEHTVSPGTLDLILNSVEEHYDRESGKAKKYWNLFESWRPR